MRNSSNDKKSPADPAAAHIEVVFYPYRDDTAAVASLVRGLGSRAVRLRIWSGHLPCNRSDLRGANGGTVTKLLCGELWDALAAPQRHPVAQAADTARGASSAPLEGPQGEAWHQPCLDFLTGDLGTPGGIDRAGIVKNGTQRL